MANLYCRDCQTPINPNEAHALKDKTGEPLCLDCADYYYDVTIVDLGVVTTGCSTWQGDGPKKREVAEWPNPLSEIHNYSVPDWKPLEAAVTAARLPLSVCGEFMWMCENPAGNHQYKHRDTRKYVHLSAAGVRPFDLAILGGARK